MNNHEILRRKLEYATKEELLFILLNDTDNKFKRVAALWEANNVEGTQLAGRLIDNLTELKLTLNTKIGDKNTQDALQNIYYLYEFIIDEIMFSSFSRDIPRFKQAHEVFLNVKSIFDADMQNLRKS